jgi:putative transport protein
VRVVTDRARLDAVAAFFGDSYRALSELDILAFSVGPRLAALS